MNVLLILFFYITTTVWRALIIWLSRVCARVCEMQTKEKWCRHPRSVEFVCRLVDDSYSSLPATNPASSWVNNPFLSFLSCVFFCSFLFFFLGGRNGDESNQFAAPVVFFLFVDLRPLSFLFCFFSFFLSRLPTQPPCLIGGNWIRNWTTFPVADGARLLRSARNWCLTASLQFYWVLPSFFFFSLSRCFHYLVDVDWIRNWLLKFALNSSLMASVQFYLIAEVCS